MVHPQFNWLMRGPAGRAESRCPLMKPLEFWVAVKLCEIRVLAAPLRVELARIPSLFESGHCLRQTIHLSKCASATAEDHGVFRAATPVRDQVRADRRRIGSDTHSHPQVQHVREHRRESSSLTLVDRVLRGMAERTKGTEVTVNSILPGPT